MADSESRVSAALRRIHDKLAALRFPYYFNEDLNPSDLADALFAGVSDDWFPLRDAVVFAEESIIAFYDGIEREALRVEGAEGGGLFVASLVIYLTRLSRAKLRGCLAFPAASRRRVTSAMRRLSDVSAATTAVEMTEDLLTLIDCVLDCAVATATADDCGAEEVSISHQQWLRDHPKRLVTSVAAPPVFAESTLSAEEDEAAVRELLEPVFALRGVDMPESNAAALADVVRLVQSLPPKEDDAKKDKKGGSASTPDAVVVLLNEIPSLTGKPSSGGKKGARATGVEEAGRILRLLYTLDLKALQDDANGKIAELQNLTAQCKTDPRLGRVGR